MLSPIATELKHLAGSLTFLVVVVVGSEVATLRFGVFNSNGTLFSPAEIEIPTEKFTLITGTFDGSKVRLYVDGLLVGEREFEGEYSGDPGLPLRIGSEA